MTTRALEDSEIRLIFQHVDGYNAVRNRAMLIVGIGMALRASELVGLKVGDVYNGKEVRTYVTIRAETAKFNKERTIRVGDAIRQEIASFILWKIENDEPIEPSSPLFRSNKGGHLGRIGLFNLIKKIFYKAEIEQSPHCLRKTGATIYYIESEYDLIATQQFLGHADPSTTRRYIGLTTEQLIDYSERLAEHLNSLIYGKRKAESNRKGNMFDFSSVSSADLFVELAKRGFNIDDLIEQDKKKAKVVKFPGRG